MKKIMKNVAGIDIGSKEFFVAVGDEKIERFFTFTEDIERLIEYLLQHKIESVAMEATGVYWYILYDMLEKAGFDVWLVDGRSTKQVPGRKTDVKDCQWIRELHSYGLLNRCFIPDDLIQELRVYQRLREDHISIASMHINHMQKALTSMNIRLKEVISQVHGVSGMRIIKAILKGERDPQKLVLLCDSRILNKKKDDVLKALNGHYNDRHIFALRQAVECYEFYQSKVTDCDKEIALILKKLNGDKTPEDKKKTKANSSPQTRDRKLRRVLDRCVSR